ncbi:hypothetical protein EDC45_0746 [Mesocricetibacter intestinalis]|uniref:Lipoprotein n=1 Tax=Mesocricetibacter intestinalis TaxID=1521930 RepID=A0A4R6VDY4_9PAST|nr:hypothetical protein [Mesocricetibacter intestinalis]TDQ58954.1 hypothetical protein EDC45_0746 [Mesocricetibacter intestinalis]
MKKLIFILNLFVLSGCADPFLSSYRGQNINNLKFVYDSEVIEEKSKFLNKIYNNDGVRTFNYLED